LPRYVDEAGEVTAAGSNRKEIDLGSQLKLKNPNLRIGVFPCNVGDDPGIFNLVPEKIRIQLTMSEEINKLLDDLARKELRTRSAIVELALLAYAAKLKDAGFDPPA
jgi:Ribbon-helix-helix protein, copG family